MIASPNDIRSAIRVYYADLNTADQSTAPLTTRERAPTLPGDRERPPPSPRRGRPSAGSPRAPPSPPVTGRAPLATVVDTVESSPSRRSPRRAKTQPQRRRRACAGTMPTPIRSSRWASTSSASASRAVRAWWRSRSSTEPRSTSRRDLPPRGGGEARELRPPSAGGLSDQLTARDLVSALRAVAHGANGAKSWARRTGRRCSRCRGAPEEEPDRRLGVRRRAAEHLNHRARMSINAAGAPFA